MRQARLAALVVGGMLFGSMPLLGSDGPTDRTTLLGIKAFKVIIEQLDAESAGVSTDQLQTDVELRLRQSGITVDENNLIFLYVAVNSLKLQNVYVSSIIVELVQPVALIPGQARMAYGATWSTNSILSSTSMSSHAGRLRDGVRDAVDKFINAYLSVNPKR